MDRESTEGLHQFVSRQQVQFEEDVAAIREAIDDILNGDRGVPFSEFDREFRLRNQIPD